MAVWKKKRLTMMDLAKQLNLSRSAFIQALYGDKKEKSSVRVSEETRARVHALVKKMNYRPDRMAQSLRTGRSGMVAILAAHEFGHIVPHQLYLARQYAEKYEMTPTYYLARDLSEKSLDLATDFILDTKVDGAVIFKDLGTARIDRIHNAGIPMVAVGIHHTNTRVPRYSADMASSYSILVEHVIDQGASNIIYLGTMEHSEWFGKQVSEGLRKGMAAAKRKGKKVSCEIHPVSISYDGFMAKGIPNMHGMYASGYVGMKELIQAGKIPDALICADSFAHGALMACAEVGIQVPRDMLIGAIGDAPVSSVGVVPLTSARMPNEELCRLALADLNTMITKGKSFAGKSITLPAQLIVRKSSQRDMAS